MIDWMPNKLAGFFFIISKQFFPLLVQFFRLMVASEEFPREAVIISIEIFPLFQGKQVEDDMNRWKKLHLKAINMLLHNYYVKGIKGAKSWRNKGLIKS